MGGGGGIGGIIGGIIGVALAPETGGLSMALYAGLGSALGTAAGEVATGQQLNPLAIGIAGAGGAIGGYFGGAGGAAGDAAGKATELSTQAAINDSMNLFSSQALVDAGITGTTNTGMQALDSTFSDMAAQAMQTQLTPQYYLNAGLAQTADEAYQMADEALQSQAMFGNVAAGNSATGSADPAAGALYKTSDYANTGLKFAQVQSAINAGISPQEALDTNLKDAGLSSFWDKVSAKATDPQTLAKAGLGVVKAALTPAQMSQQDTRQAVPQGFRTPTDTVSLGQSTPVTTRAMADAGAGSNVAQPILSVQQAAGGPGIAMPSAAGGGGMQPRQVTPVQLGLGGTIQSPKVAGTPDAPWFTNDPALRPLVLRSLGEYYDDSDSALSRMFTPQGRR